MDNIAAYVERYRTFDEPVPFNGLLIYPIKVRDYFKFITCVDVLRIEKNKIPDIEIIQMSYLSFVLRLIMEEDMYKQYFIEICKLCFHAETGEKFMVERFDQDQILYRKNGDVEIFYINGYNIKFIQQGTNVVFYINDTAINGSEFDEIIDIICYLNFPNYDNEEMSEDFKRVMEEYYTLKNKNIKPPTLEEQIIAVMGQTGMSKNELINETVYTLQAMVDSLISKTDYMVQHMYRSHAMTDKKLPDIEHWLIKFNKDKYANVFSDLEEYKQNFEI